jgi:hypothetical protein
MRIALEKEWLVDLLEWMAGGVDPGADKGRRHGGMWIC